MVTIYFRRFRVKSNIRNKLKLTMHMMNSQTHYQATLSLLEHLCNGQEAKCKNMNPSNLTLTAVQGMGMPFMLKTCV